MAARLLYMSMTCRKSFANRKTVFIDTKYLFSSPILCVFIDTKYLFSSPILWHLVNTKQHYKSCKKLTLTDYMKDTSIDLVHLATILLQVT